MLQKRRSVIYAHFVEEVGEEAAQAMLDQFPVRDVDELVTKEYLAQQMAELRVEMGKQTERLMTRMQIVVGVAFAAFSALVLAVR